MKNAITTFFISAFLTTGFSQGSQQIQLYLQQIAANKVLIEYIQTGYKIAKAGLTTIGNIKNGEFKLHQDFFASLQQVNPNIKNLGIVADIIARQMKIIQTCQKSFGRLQQYQQFSANELDYIRNVFDKLLHQANNCLNDLSEVVTNNIYQMSDDERISRLNHIHQDMEHMDVFVQAFSQETLMLAQQRFLEKRQIENSSTLQGIDLKP